MNTFLVVTACSQELASHRDFLHPLAKEDVRKGKKNLTQSPREVSGCFEAFTQYGAV